MSKQNLQNKRLDQIGRKLLEAASARAAEIERIVAAPQLFDSVKASIKISQAGRSSKRFFGFRAGFPAWSWQRAVISFAVLAVFAIGLVGVIVFIKYDSSPQLAEQSIVPEIQTPITPVDIPQPVNEDLPKKQKAKSFVVKNRIHARRTVLKTETAALPKPARKANVVKRQTESEVLGEFYALTYTGNLGDTGEDWQIIRTEISRSSLFALGVNLSIENESEKLKTDLLVGSDGVPRAIRFVK
jgi:hypothetical protein